MNLKRLLSGFLIMCIIICAICFAINVHNNIVHLTSIKNVDRVRVIIDAGHGGFDGGAVAPSDKTVEKDLNLLIVLKLEKLFSAMGIDTVLTRESDISIESDPSQSIHKRKVSDMNNRLNYMKKYENSIFLSVHLNKFSSSAARGSQVFYAPSADGSLQLAELIQIAIKSYLQPENERVVKKGNKDTYLLYNAAVPSVIVECGFLSNSTDLELLKNDEYQSKIAFSIVSGVLKYLE